jgi:hypothetical protein
VVEAELGKRLLTGRMVESVVGASGPTTIRLVAMLLPIAVLAGVEVKSLVGVRVAMAL